MFCHLLSCAHLALWRGKGPKVHMFMQNKKDSRISLVDPVYVKLMPIDKIS